VRGATLIGITHRLPALPGRLSKRALATAFESLSLPTEGLVTPYFWKRNTSKKSRLLGVSDASASGLEAAERDAADLLYRYGIGSIVVSILASSGLAFISIGQVRSRLLGAWWFLITLVLVLRAIDILHFHKLRTSWARPGRLEIRRFATGVIATAALWATFSLAFLRELNQTGRACTTIILCGMVGGSATVLSPSRPLAFLFCAFLVLPTSVLFLSFPGSENTFLGILGCAFFTIMYASSRVTNRATMTAVRLSRANEVLLAAMEQGRQRTEAANLELRVAEAALSEANQSLEIRIQARTADLEKEIGEKERYAKELAYHASTDSLTGLWNRATLTTRLSRAIARAETAGRSLAVLFLDLEKFKEVNDVMGHLAGDLVLQVAARRLLHHLPPGVELARWGGDEFVVAISGLDNADRAIDLAGELSQCLRDPIEIDSGIVRIDATIGIALFPDHGRTEVDLIRAADIAMYASKEEKRSKIRVFDPSLSRRLTERHLLERALRDAIHNRELEIVFQPIITASTGECETLEALVRWNHPERGPVSPDDFIPLAERSGEIGALGRWVLGEACREAASWPGHKSPSVAVNVSAVQIESGTLQMDIATALKEAALPPSRLYLELTESVFAGDRRQIIPTLSALRDSGVRISLDDFGTGFSCLADLRRLPIDQLKIDKSFVESLDVDSGPIVNTIVTTAQTFGLEVVAEGVETAAQAEKLVGLGVHYLQGYLFSGILSPDAARQWLLHQRPAIPSKMTAGAP
jgi:diguanylate cyclase (GGDEF)-like protein